MDINQIKEKLSSHKIISVIAIKKEKNAIPLVDALIVDINTGAWETITSNCKEAIKVID